MSEKRQAGASPSPSASRSPASDVDATLTSRYECKYLVEPERIGAIRRWIQPFVRPDRFAVRCPHYRYWISSLYYDSADLGLLAMTQQGIKNRFKLRVRTYGDDPEDPVFIEVKKRMAGIVYKRRARLPRVAALLWLQGLGGHAPLRHASCEADLLEFRQLAEQVRAQPVMRVKYLREAYESTGGDPVRITFDSSLHGAVTGGLDLRHEGHDWFPTPLGGMVFELKFTELFPSWAGDLIGAFDLERCSVAKYVLSMERAIEEGRCRRPIHAGARDWLQIRGARSSTA